MHGLASRRDNSPYPKASILGVRVHAVTFEQALAQIEAFIAAGGPHQVATVNPEFVVAAQKDDIFRQIINRAALSFPDGNGLLKAARWLNQPRLPERIPGVDVVEALASLSARKGYRIYFLGARPGVAEKAIEVLQQRYPGMVAAGAFAGSPRAEDEDDIVAKIQAARPDIVLVAYGAPRQDKWIARNMHRLPASVLMGVGGAFDFISGATRRAPRWMQQMSLEWLHRFIQQPSRWRRMWNAVPRFLGLVFVERVKGKDSQELIKD
jgi:N-acetylglucosaminyldiphosphoundecaprenol N-acetyl-beta-D-mannosaminyltransferase